jgi:hypothetical protein
MAQNIEPSRIRNVRQVAGTSTTELMSQDGITKSFEKKITHGTSQPSSPAIGDLWLDTSSTPHVLKRYKDATSQWVNVGVGTSYTHPNHSGDVTSTGDGATSIGTSKVVTNHIADKNVTLAKLPDIAASSLLGKPSGSAGAPEVLTAAQARTILNVADGANAYTHPSYSGNIPSTVLATNVVISQITRDATGHTTGVTTRNLTAADIGAQASSAKASAAEMTAGTEDTKFTTAKIVFDWFTTLRTSVGITATVRWLFSYIRFSPNTTAPSSPLEGDIWHNGNSLKFQKTSVVGTTEIVTTKDNEVFKGVGRRVAELTASGDIDAQNEIIDGEITDPELITAITNGTYDSNFRLTLAVTGKTVYKGQFYAVNSYFYFAVLDNVILKMRGAA